MTRISCQLFGTNATQKRNPAAMILAVCMMLLSFSHGGILFAASTEYESLEDIRQTAIEYAQEQLWDTTGRVDVDAGRLDSRLKLARCSQPLTASSAPGAGSTGRTSVSVECNGDNPWRLYVRLNVRQYGMVVVAKHALPRGTEISPADLILEERDLTSLRQGYAQDTRIIVGRKLKRSIRANEVIPTRTLAIRNMVETGQNITIQADTDAIRIRMNGTALNDGSKGDRVRVRNVSSERIVEGIVIADGVVRVGP